MGKVLILRTFTHSKIWDNWDKQECVCHFEDSYIKNKTLIMNMEPRLLTMKTSEITFALGIYMRKYFEYNNANKGTQDERKISLLEVDWFDRKIFDSDKDEIFAKEIDNKLEIRTKRPIHKKFDNSLEQMFNFDNEIVNLRLSLSNINKGQYAPLCFLLEEDIVNNKLKDVGINF